MSLRRWRCSLALHGLLRRLHAFVQGALSAMTLRAGAPPVAVSNLFLRCDGEIVRVRYRWDSRWYTAKLRSQDIDGTYTAILSDGFIQFGTPEADVWRGNFKLDDLTGLPMVNDVALAQADDEDLSIWTAAKFGDVDLIKSLLAEGAPLNEPEQLKGGQSGRSPLYWACLCGHQLAARILLERGATDLDGAAWDAVTAAVGDGGDKNVIASASADLLYDPDEGIYTEFEEDQPESQIGGEDTSEAESGKTPATMRDLLGTLTTAFVPPSTACPGRLPASTHGCSVLCVCPQCCMDSGGIACCPVASPIQVQYHQRNRS